MRRPAYLIIGNVTRDLTPDGPILGGTCSYASVLARKLGVDVGIVTRYGPDVPDMSLLEGIPVHHIPHDCTTTFENIYTQGKRTQYMTAQCGVLSIEHIPPAWKSIPNVLLAPMAQDFSPLMARSFSENLVAATAQGWLRGRDGNDRVTYEPHKDLGEGLAHVDILVMSEADVLGQRKDMEWMLDQVGIGVETLGPEGCLIYTEGERLHIPVEPVEEVDPTGAGDIFTAAFMIAYAESHDPVQAARFANACASLSVGRVGVDGTPTRTEVDLRIQQLYA